MMNCDDIAFHLELIIKEEETLTRDKLIALKMYGTILGIFSPDLSVSDMR